MLDKIKSLLLSYDTPFQCWSQLQDHSHHYKFQSEIIMIVLYSCLWQHLKPPYLLLSSSSLSCLLQNKDHTELLFPFPAEPSLQEQKLSICSPLQFHHPTHLSCPSSASCPYLLTLLVYLFSKPVSPHVQLHPILTCPGMVPSLLTSKYSVLPLSEAVFLQNNPNSFPICLCFTF